ncbi:uncharacterized protein EV420DRAFT_1500213 [Desarmillaria tabescens]|uniref:Uncharacterized protein n=1 Tax=Armillaria tabescens TaxID=1929756 RepID=A0AA39T7T1_ARMTA|nr:uncharacterized protein EV420DRAFT_1500213 [Desarmillaria tabescens]KAK0470381.1 hypothetical protein EV420DRAFT_1500213 [Desarmillaria tabescens]
MVRSLYPKFGVLNTLLIFCFIFKSLESHYDFIVENSAGRELWWRCSLCEHACQFSCPGCILTAWGRHLFRGRLRDVRRRLSCGRLPWRPSITSGICSKNLSGLPGAYANENMTAFNRQISFGVMYEPEYRDDICSSMLEDDDRLSSCLQADYASHVR